MIGLQDNDFALFGLPEQFAQDLALIQERWKTLQREAHPDKFAAQGAAAQRVAAQFAARINEAHQRLRDPLARAAYLCGLRGHPVDAHSNTAMPAAFLMQQMAWREDLEEAKNTQNERILDNIAKVSSDSLSLLLQKIELLLDVEQNPIQAAQRVREALFIQKFRQYLDSAYDKLAA